jgi:hypothetical protein
MGLHDQARNKESCSQLEPISDTTVGGYHQDLDGILLVRCYFCTLVSLAKDACSLRGIWICSDCYATVAVRAVVNSAIGNKEVL